MSVSATPGGHKKQAVTCNEEDAQVVTELSTSHSTHHILIRDKYFEAINYTVTDTETYGTSEI